MYINITQKLSHSTCRSVASFSHGPLLNGYMWSVIEMEEQCGEERASLGGELDMV